MSNPLRRRPHPLLLQIPVRSWLRGLSDAAGRPVSLADVPDARLDEIGRRGFDGVWLMGAWTTGPASRAKALLYPDLLSAYEALVPDWEPSDVGGSPYSIRAYVPHAALGGADALAAFRERLRARGLGLVLDFVPNHVAIDHPWLDDRPELLVRGTARDLARDPANWFVHTTPDGEDRVFAHGRDPYFAGWTDTCQIDYRRADARAAMRGVLGELANQCDGLRCDMAMLVLEDVFRRTWGDGTGNAGDGASGGAGGDGAASSASRDYWSDALPVVRRDHPELVLIAEVYWGLEGRLREIGFDFTYDKDLYDKLLANDWAGIRGRAEEPLDAQAGCVRFLENHDEARARSAFGAERQRPASALTYSLPGLRFFQEGQAEGRRHRVPIQLSRAPDEPTDAACAAFHTRIFAWLGDAALHEGTWHPATLRGEDDASPAPDGVFGNAWCLAERAIVVVANFREEAVRVRVARPTPFERSSSESREDTIPVDVPPLDCAVVPIDG